MYPAGRLLAATISQRGQIKSVPNLIYLKAGKTFRMYQRLVGHRPLFIIIRLMLLILFNFLNRFTRVDISPIPRHTRACTGNVTSCCFAESRSFLNFDPAAVLQCCRAETRGDCVQHCQPQSLGTQEEIYNMSWFQFSID